MSRPVKITVAEPSEIVRKGLLSILCRIRQFSVEVLEVADEGKLRSSLLRQRPDILIINPALMTVLPFSQLKKEFAVPDMKYVALQTSLADTSVLKHYDEVISLYDTPEQIADKLDKLVSGPETDKRHEALSEREKEVITYVVKGMTNKQIADKLNLSAHTVITHRRNISVKLGIHSAAGLTIYAIVNKMVELDDISK